MAESTWHERELVILEAVRAAEEPGGDLESAARSAVPDLDQALYLRTMKSLVDARLIEGKVLPSASGPVRAVVKGLTPEGRRAVGQWPSPGDLSERLLQIIDEQLADDATDAEARNKLQRLRSAAADVSKSTLAGLLTAAIRGTIPMP